MFGNMNPMENMQRDPGHKESEGFISVQENNIHEIFKLSPDLARVAGGTSPEAVQLYKKYLETIFPESKVKDIVWHGTTSEEEFSEFDVEKESSFGFKKHGGVFFTSSLEDAKTRGSGSVENQAKRIIPSVVDIKNPVMTGEKEISKIDDKVLAEGQQEIDTVLSTEGVLERWATIGWKHRIEDDKLIVTKPPRMEKEIGLFNSDNNLVIDLSHNMNFIGNLNEYQIKPLKSMGYDAVIDDGSEIVRKSGLEGEKKWIIVFDPSQIHILGSESDTKRFKEFVAGGKLENASLSYAFSLTQEAEEQAEVIHVSDEDKDEHGSLLAYKGGPQSNLDEHAWRVVRTDNFKEQFGEWQQYLGLEKKELAKVLRGIEDTTTDLRQKTLASLLLQGTQNLDVALFEGENPHKHLGTAQTNIALENGELKSTNDFIISEPELYTSKEGYNETVLHESLHYLTNHIILLLEDENNKEHDYLLNDAEKDFYKNLKAQFDFFMQKADRPEQERWLNTYEFLTYVLTEKSHQEQADKIAADIPGSETSEYGEKSNTLLNAVYNNFKKFLSGNDNFGTRIQDGFRRVSPYLDANGEPRITMSPVKQS